MNIPPFLPDKVLIPFHVPSIPKTLLKFSKNFLFDLGIVKSGEKDIREKKSSSNMI